MKRIDEFIAYLRSHVNKAIYVWGAQGQTDITKSWIRRRESGDEKQVQRVLKLWDKRKAEGIEPIYAFDCSGLIMYFLQNVKGWYKSDMSSAGLYSDCKKLDRAGLEKGDLVFRHNGTKIYHVGVYVGDGKVIECMGRDVGVVERDINASGTSYWNRYGRLPVLHKVDETVNNSVDDTDKKGCLYLTSPLMRGEEVKLLQITLMSLGYDVGSTKADGIYGKNTDKAVRLFQERAKKLTDGIYDANMRELLGLNTGGVT